MAVKPPPLRYLIYFVTARCNLRCSHCFYLDELGPSDDLTPEEIEKFCKSLGSLTFLRMTGGEPFLRKDLSEVIRLFYDITGTRRMGVITNGTKHENVQNTLESISKTCPKLTLDVGVSIDDIGEEHDAIRKKKGVYDEAVGQIQQLLDFQKHWPNLEVSTVVTANGKNTPRLREIYNQLHSLGVNRISCNLVRGYVADQELSHVDLDAYYDFLDWTDQHNREHHRGWSATLRRAKNQVGRQVVREIVNSREAGQPLAKFRPFGRKSQAVTDQEYDRALPEGDGHYLLGSSAPLRCQAGSAIAVLQPEGDVNLCEVLDWPLGNVREANYDWNAIWEGERAEAGRRMIVETGCSCTHECFLTASILFGKDNYPRLGKEFLKESIASLVG
jgi:MoaA/NifB/PqqE/SkfB family radical SAM enzyme